MQNTLYEELKMARNNTLEMLWPQPNLKYCSSICLGMTEEKWLKKTRKRQSMHPDLNLGPLKHKIGTFTAEV